MIAMGWNREGANRGETRPVTPEEIAHVRHALRKKFAALVEASATAPLWPRSRRRPSEVRRSP